MCSIYEHTSMKHQCFLSFIKKKTKCEKEASFYPVSVYPVSISCF